jgi:hypothetical protein
MPLPKPGTGETEDDWVGRCMTDGKMKDEFPGNEQRLAVCHNIWSEKSMSKTNPNDAMLAAIRSRQQKRTEFGYGIMTADKYVSTLQDHVGLDTCYRFASRGQTSFHDAMEKAAKTLVYSNRDCAVEEVKDAAGLKKLQKKMEFPKDTLMAFQHTLTTPRKDRDGDIMRTGGAELDDRMLLLWQHVHTLPIGKMVGVVEHTDEHLKLVSAIVDMNELSHDAAVMVDNDMGRFSHGFRAIEFDEIKEAGEKEPSGFDVKRFEIMEESLVSVPSNVDADTEDVLLSLAEGGKFMSTIMKRYGKFIREHRPKSVPVGIDLKLIVNGKEINDAIPDGSSEGEGEGEGGGSPKQADEPERKTQEGAGTEDAKGGDTGGEVKGFGDLEGSWEKTQSKLRDAAKPFLKAANLGVKEDDWVWVTATFQDHAVLCWESKDGSRYFKTPWFVGDDGPEFTGEPKEVEFKVELEEVEKLRGPDGEKAGRVLSKANENKIRDAVGGISDVIGMDISRPAKATLREANTGLGQVLDSLGKEEEKPKTAEVSLATASAFLLFQTTKAQREELMKMLDVVSGVENQKEKVKELRALLRA